ncbi:unnamed protein product [Oncorhynchus mykiss]|uniref:Reverse transcriptase domain-containing protein n=1 Tax=Oncorhynchus mykiss TaxID=8022 RepID=A0A060VZP4_ONCMY|nr:unnamed protein product [Oncorhynchus mykiss]
MPMTLSKVRVSMYVDDSTLYTSAATATEMTATLNKELQLVSEWVARNKLALNTSKTKSIVFGTKYSLNPKPQLIIVINHVEIEQVEMTKLLGVTLDCKLSWSKHIDAVVAKMGRSLSILLCLLNHTINKASPTGPSFVPQKRTCENCNWLRTGQHS